MALLQSYWYLRSTPDESKLAEWDDSVVLDGPITCAAHPEHQRAGKRLSDLSVAIAPKVDDFVWTWQSDCLVQEHVVALFRKARVTGFDPRPVSAHFRRARSASNPPVVPKLQELVVTGWGGVLPPSTGVQLASEESCTCCGLLKYTGVQNTSTFADDIQWDGSDIFMIWPYPRYRFVTDRVADLIRSHELTGVVLRNASGFADDLRSRNLASPDVSPGRLSYWMPEARAKALGVPLGIY